MKLEVLSLSCRAPYYLLQHLQPGSTCKAYGNRLSSRIRVVHNAMLAVRFHTKSINFPFIVCPFLMQHCEIILFRNVFVLVDCHSPMPLASPRAPPSHASFLCLSGIDRNVIFTSISDTRRQAARDRFC